MLPFNIATYGIGSVAFFGIISIILQKIVGRKPKPPIIQATTQPDTLRIDKEQALLTNQIEQAQKGSKETRAKIKTILQTAAKEVQESLNEDSIKTIENLDKGWDDI